MADNIYFHEDDYRQIELVPQENFHDNLKFITEESVNVNSSEYGFESIIERKEQKLKLSDRNISLIEICKILDPICLSFSEYVETGYGQAVFVAGNTVVWGFERYGIFVKYNKDFIVEAIWLCSSFLFSQDNSGKTLSKALSAIADVYKLILIDWNKEIIVSINMVGELEKYLNMVLGFDS